MKQRILLVLFVFVLVGGLFAGCDSKEAAKTEEELKAELMAEMEAEAKEREEMEAEIRAKLEAELEAEAGSTEQDTEQKPEEVQQDDENEAETTKEADIPEAPKSGGKTEKPKDEAKEVNTLLESDEAQGYYKYKANAAVKFDIDKDGNQEEIEYDSASGKLNITGYKAVDIDTMFAEKDYFVIVKFMDKYNTEMNMIGIIDYGPSNDPSTALYSIIEPMGEKWFGSVGVVPGELVSPAKYDENSMNDFNYKAVLRKGKGIEAPVRLSVLPHATWFGRNTFTYYSTYSSLIDNIEVYEQDYDTKMELKVENDVRVYSEKDVSSQNVTVNAGKTVYIIATDNDEWIGIATLDGLEGWIPAKDVTPNSFSGFPIFD